MKYLDIFANIYALKIEKVLRIIVRVMDYMYAIDLVIRVLYIIVL